MAQPEKVAGIWPKLAGSTIAPPAFPCYCWDMEAISIPAFTPGRLCLVRARHSTGKPLVNEFVARLALAAPVTVIDANGMALDPLLIARVLRMHTENYLPLLERVHIARAFTCHELAAMLEGEVTGREAVIVLDFFSSLDDENLSDIERKTVFERLVRRLMGLRLSAPLLVWIRPVVLPQTGLLAERLVELSDPVLSFFDHAPQPAQLQLF